MEDLSPRSDQRRFEYVQPYRWHRSHKSDHDKFRPCKSCRSGKQHRCNPEKHEWTSGETAPIRVLVPNKRSTVEDWTGSVYLAQYDTLGGKSASFIIDGGTPMSGGYSGNTVTAPDPKLPVGSFTNQTYFGDPVSVANGNMFSDELDFTFANPFIPLDFAATMIRKTSSTLASWPVGFIASQASFMQIKTRQTRTTPTTFGYGATASGTLSKTQTTTFRIRSMVKPKPAAATSMNSETRKERGTSSDRLPLPNRALANQ